MVHVWTGCQKCSPVYMHLLSTLWSWGKKDTPIVDDNKSACALDNKCRQEQIIIMLQYISYNYLLLYVLYNDK